jgi:HAD superfamily hydrolase (TIGR01459 family)
LARWTTPVKIGIGDLQWNEQARQNHRRSLDSGPALANSSGRMNGFSTTPTSMIDGLSSIAGRYDVVLCDLWGVVHNGRHSFPAATGALARFRAGGGAVIMITNAPRPSGPIRDQLDHLQVPRTAYNAVVTSGDVTIDLIRARGRAPVHHIGPLRDLSLFETIDEIAPGEAPPRAPLGEADYVLCTGLFDDTRETPEDYDATLAAMLARKLPMICANPDLVIHRGQDLIYCAGAIAERYARMGGETIFAGKPHAAIYERALTQAGVARGAPIDNARVLAIGDAMRTDIAGALAQGLDALFVASGIHRDELAGSSALDAAAVQQFSTRHGMRPTAMISELVW